MKKRRLIIAILFLSSAIILTSLYLYNNYLVKHQPIIYNDTVDNNDNTDPIIANIKKLALENNDLVGWIKIDNTNIDYPIMYSQDDFYLYKDFYKNDFKAGSIYIDKHNTLNPRDTNLIIHGHSMKDGSMFHDLLNYKDKDYYLNHKIITLYTLEEKQEYEIIAVILSEVYKTNDNVFKYYQFYKANNKEEYDNFIKNIKEKSLYDIDSFSYYKDELITLSTCEYSKENSRIAIIAKKIT